jgi:hypothetical protein
VVVAILIGGTTYAKQWMTKPCKAAGDTSSVTKAKVSQRKLMYLV